MCSSNNSQLKQEYTLYANRFKSKVKSENFLPEILMLLYLQFCKALFRLTQGYFPLLMIKGMKGAKYNKSLITGFSFHPDQFISQSRHSTRRVKSDWKKNKILLV